MNDWLKKNWYKLTPIVMILIGGIYGMGAHETNQDSTLKHTCEKQKQIEELLRELDDNQAEQLEQTAIITEFLRLFQEELFNKAEENINNNDST